MRTRTVPRLRFDGAKLQRLREQTGLSQVALAERARVSRRSIQRWEHVNPRTRRSPRSPRSPRVDRWLRVLYVLRTALRRVVGTQDFCSAVRTMRVPA